MLTLLVLEAAVVTAIDVTIHNTGLQRGIVMTEGALKRFNLLNLLLSLSCEARTGTIIEVYAMVGRFAGLAILLLHIVSRLVLICTSLAHFTPMAISMAMAPRYYGAAAPAPTCGMLYNDGQF